MFGRLDELYYLDLNREQKDLILDWCKKNFTGAPITTISIQFNMGNIAEYYVIEYRGKSAVLTYNEDGKWYLTDKVWVKNVQS